MINRTQFYDYQINTAPANLPLTLEEVEAHLRIPADSEDTYLTFLIHTVRKFFEKYTNRTLVNTTYKAFLDEFPNSSICNKYEYGNCSNSYCEEEESGILIRKSKVSSITSIKYYIDSVLTTWDSSNYYFTNSNSYPKVFLTENAVYPEIDNKRQAIEIIFVAGFGADNTYIPYDVKLALLNHLAFLYENRGDCSDDTCRLPCPVKTIYDQYRIVPIGWGGC